MKKAGHVAVLRFPHFEESNEDFGTAGIKVKSVIRIARLAVVSGDGLVGAVGEISPVRLGRIRRNLSAWIGNI